MTWFIDHLDEVWTRTLQHAYLAGLPLVIGLLYTIPSLALFVLMPAIIGTNILSPTNVVVGLTLYTLALLVRTVADGLGAVPDHVKQSAMAMGYTPVKRFFAVDLPLAVPVISAGLRVAAVSNVSIASVATIIGVPQLGLFFSDGFSRNFYDPLIVGIVGCIVLALVFDAVILVMTRAFTPWVRATGGRA